MNNPTIWQDVATPVAIDATVSCTSGTAAPNCVATSSVIYAHFVPFIRLHYICFSYCYVCKIMLVKSTVFPFQGKRQWSKIKYNMCTVNDLDQRSMSYATTLNHELLFLDETLSLFSHFFFFHTPPFVEEILPYLSRIQSR